MPLVQDSCVDLLCTLTSTKYIKSNKLIEDASKNDNKEADPKTEEQEIIVESVSKREDNDNDNDKDDDKDEDDKNITPLF